MNKKDAIEILRKEVEIPDAVREKTDAALAQIQSSRAGQRGKVLPYNQTSRPRKRSRKRVVLISAAALIRVIWRLCYDQSMAPLFSYNALFVPLFFLGGLLCLVMSALFRQAAEMKAENDLTI